MNNIINYTLAYSLINHIGISYNQRILSVQIIKLYISLLSTFQYLYYDDSFTPMKDMLVSYFLYHSLYIILYDGISNVVSIGLLYHHISLIVTFLYEPLAYINLPYYIFIGEFSNIGLTIYETMIMLKDRYPVPENILKITHKTYAAIYILLRVFLLAFHVRKYENIKNSGYSFYYMNIPLYSLGFVWSYRLVNELRNQYK